MMDASGDVTLNLSLLKLKKMKGANGKPLKIIQQIAAGDYKTFGMYLLQDENGIAVDLLRRDNIHDGAESVTQAILQKWLTSDAPTRTYQHMIECLRDSELGSLAELIADATSEKGCSTALQVSGQVMTTADFGPLSSYVSYLKGVYTSMSHGHTAQHWTHLPRCKFIQLAMIRNEELRRGDREEKMVRLAQQGKIENILDDKEPIHLCELFLQLRQPLVVMPPPLHQRVILIEGPPGGGKSTLNLHICHKWAQGASFLAGFDLIILAYLRDQAIQNATTLADLLPTYSMEASQIVASQINGSHGKRVLFIFDGWDEFPLELQKKSFVATIIREPHKLSLHQSTVLITSRPVSSGNLLHVADQRVEILGFTRQQIYEYINEALNDNKTHLHKLSQHLREHPVIEGYCYVPLHAAILVHVFLTMKGALPATLHDLFCSLILCCIVRELETHESEKILSNVSSLDDLPENLKLKLNDLCALAYNGVMQNKVVFHKDDLKKYNLPTGILPLGLLQAVEGLTLVGKSLSYNFLHQSVQEILAAYYISNADSSKQVESFEHMLGGSRFQAVLQYYSGFTKLANRAVRDLVSIHSQQQSRFTDILPLLHCFFEAQEQSLCQLVGTRFTQQIHLHSQLNAVDFIVVGYFIASLLSLSAKKLSLKIEEIDEHCLNLLLLQLSKYPIGEVSATGCSASLEVEINAPSLSETCFKLIAAYLKDSLVVSKLSILFCHIENNESLLHFAEALLTNNCLTELLFTYVLIPCKQHDGPAIVRMLQTNKSMKRLSLSKVSGISLTIPNIFEGIRQNTTLVYLNLSSVLLSATEDTTRTLTAMLRENRTLTHLNLSTSEHFSDEGTHSVCQGLQHNGTLLYLNLSNIKMTNKGAQDLGRALRSNRALQTLDISYNLIEDDGFTSITESLTLNTTLSKLDIQKNHVTHGQKNQSENMYCVINFT